MQRVSAALRRQSAALRTQSARVSALQSAVLSATRLRTAQRRVSAALSVRRLRTAQRRVSARVSLRLSAALSARSSARPFIIIAGDVSSAIFFASLSPIRSYNKSIPLGEVLTYDPSGISLVLCRALRPYDRLLSLVVRAENLLNLVDVELLHIVTSRTEVLTWIELCWLLSEYLAYSSCHSQT